MGNKNHKPIIIDLDKNMIHVDIPERQINFSHDYNTRTRPFHLSVLAFVVNQMKKKNSLKGIVLEENIEEIKFLNENVPVKAKKISNDEYNISTKIKKAWQQRHKYGNWSRLFKKIYYHFDEDPMEPTFDYDGTKTERDFWNNLIKFWESGENKILKFAVDAVDLSLDDVVIIFNKNKENAWMRFLENVKPECIDETELIDDPLKSISKEATIDFSKEATIDFSKEATIDFLKDIKYNCENIIFFHRNETVEIKKQFISPRVTEEITHRHDMKSSFRYKESYEELKKAYSFKGMEMISVKSEDWEDVKEKSKKIIVLGGPGLGKSTLLMMEAFTRADLEIQNLNKLQKSLEDIIFPIYLRLFDLAKSDEEIIDDIDRIVYRDFPETYNPIKLLLIENIKKGKCILLLDALDNVPQKYRKNLSEKLNRFCTNYKCSIICTSRLTGYTKDFIHGAKEVELLPFTPKEVNKFIKTWFINATKTLKSKSISASGLLDELRNKPQIGGLSQNPLLLSLLCGIYQQEKAILPGSRSQIYKKSLHFMLCYWSNKRKHESEWVIYSKIALLEELAFYFYTVNKNIIASADLYTWIEEYLKKNNIPKELKEFSTFELLNELSSQDGIIIKLERGKDRYIFLHSAFQEYLTASYFKKIFEVDQNKGIELIKQCYWDFNWHEIITLLAGMLTNPIPLIKDIYNENDDIFCNLLVLSGRCIVECEEISNVLIVEVFEKIYKMWTVYPNERYLRSVLADLTRSHSILFKLLIKYFKNEKQNIKKIIAYLLIEIGSPKCIQELVEILKGEDSELRDIAINELKKIPRLDILKKLVESPEIDIYDPKIFSLARILAIRFSKEEVSYIPVNLKGVEKLKKIVK